MDKTVDVTIPVDAEAAALKAEGIPERALLRAEEVDVLALSTQVQRRRLHPARSRL